MDLERFFDMSLDMLAIGGYDGYFKKLNPAWKEVLGYETEELIRRPFVEFVHPEDRAATIRQMRRLIRGVSTISFKNRYRCKDGSYRVLSWKAAPSREERLIYAAARDITHREQSEEALSRLSSIVEASDDGIISTSVEGVILTWNSGAERLYGYQMGEIVGRPYFLLVPDEQREEWGEILEQVQRGCSVQHYETIRKRKDGRKIHVSLTISPIRRGSEITAISDIARDISRQREAQEALMRAKETAEQASRAKDMFLSTMSHELRTPLNAVLGFSDLLKDERLGALTERQRRYVDHINHAGRHLLQLINDILDLSKIEAGRLDLEIADVLVETAFKEVLTSMSPLAGRRNQMLSSEAGTGLTVRADPRRLNQVLYNLIGNAIKFTPEGGVIEVTARREKDGVRIDVSDNGPGIPQEHQDRIFEAFNRLRQHGTAVEGTGLGLAISKRLVELHGGTLHLESTVGRGSRFYFFLPSPDSIENGEGVSAASEASPRRARVLVVDDDEGSSKLIGSQLAAAGYDLVICNRPEQAVETAARLQPDAITLDLLMNPKPGWVVLFELKRDRRTSAIPVVIVTVMDHPGKGVAILADEYLMKPVDKQSLTEAIARCLRKRGIAPPPPQPILVVEDDAATREMITETLSSLGYGVEAVADGARALEWVNRHLPSLVILDLMLPGISGIELLSRWRSQERTLELPVFVLTGKELSRQEQEYLRGHAEFLFRKDGAWKEDLLEQLRRALRPSAEPVA